MKSAQEIRKDFLEYFQEKNHEIVPSDSIVPGNDPTLLFTNAGMNQFKDVFLGEGSRSYVRAVDTQKCLRVSGKHNDLDEVGYDTYHHTFFEMLGNWSFGDYFKKEAVAWAWELLVDKWGIEPDRLYATVHEGDSDLGLEADEDAAGFWRSETGIDPEHIMYCPSKDNFWMMGETGPCGPCSEIHVDMRSDEERAAVPGAELVNADHPEVIEIWNLVFIQYNAIADGSLKPLESVHVDTGMGLERVVAILQGKKSNYETDLFIPILDAIVSKADGVEANSYEEVIASSQEDSESIAVALRVIADHLRTVSFAIADGVVPGNAGRGYVIRRILRRAVRYGYQTLGFRSPVLHELVEVVTGTMGEQFPELVKGKSYIQRVVKAEEVSFLETLGMGIEYFGALSPIIAGLSSESSTGDERDKIAGDRVVLDLLKKAYVDGETRDQMIEGLIKSGKSGQLPGEVAFLLHDTYGFPVDLTQLMAREAGFGVDMSRYEELMDQQRSRARAAASFQVDDSATDDWVAVSEGDDSEFTGYESTSGSGGKIRKIRRVEGKDGSSGFEIVLDSTPFYAESGGQVGDTGTLDVGGEVIKVLDTRKKAGQIIHTVDKLPEDASSEILSQVDSDRRSRIVKHHSVTHLVHAALREQLGDHVGQKGSLVAPDHLRFDFSHFERVTPADLLAVESRVNELIQRNIEKTEDLDVPIKEALARGAMALFGEKYGETVRMITFDPEVSIELCGGIHVNATGEIGLFRFTSEGSVAAGIRRVQAVAGMDALSHTRTELDELERVRGQFKSLQRPSDEEVADLVLRNKALEKESSKLRLASLKTGASELASSATDHDGFKLVSGRLDGADMPALQEIGPDLRDQLGSGHVCVIGSVNEEAGKVFLSCSVSDDLIKDKGLNAGNIIGSVAKIVGGGGGGRPTFATAGGRNPEKLDEALAAVSEIVAGFIS